ncbi:Mitotic spindle checkpoint component mad2 [Geranomyces variabilis]|uniref:Mitotic spindle checkpoint component mad2 n=1 Tax=Geranomyces variabilis TaxID=109894 RepID=A0AAD5XN13_9FUNG|nr:Mitotic spindle checkpoint component mad2 [Geranomyces variabilis]
MLQQQQLLQREEKTITLKGSARIVVEFFNFHMEKKYGLNLLVTSHEGVQAYLSTILSQLDKWIVAKKISTLVLVISSKNTREVLERWSFDVQLENSSVTNEKEPTTTAAKPTSSLPSPPPAPSRTEKQTTQEIAAVMRQITASVTFLPMLDEPCTFNVLAYTEKDAVVPAEWIDSDPRLIERNAEQVKLRSFSTSVHRVDGLVAYKYVGDQL